VLNFKVIAAAWVVMLLGGCASTPQKSDNGEAASQKKAAATASPVTQPGKVTTEIDPEVLYLLLTGELAGQRGQYDVALEAYLRAAHETKDPRLAERAARIALYLKKPRQTREAVSLWLQLDADNLTARKLAALSALRTGDKPAALEHLNFLLRNDPAGFEATLLELIKMLDKEQQVSFAYDVLENMTVQHPDEALLYYVQGLLAMQMQKNQLALNKVQRALELQPEWQQAMVFQAQLAAHSGDLPRARKILQQAIEKYPDNIRLRNLLAKVYIKSGDYQQAADVYRQILQDHPDEAGARFSLALIDLQLQKYAEAKEIFLHLVDKPGLQMQASFYLGRIEAKAGNIDQALVWFDKVTSGPLVFEASINAVGLLIDTKRYDDALRRLLSLKKKFPRQQLRLLLMEAELYNEQKQYQKAFDLLTAALRENPQQKELLYTRALIAERMDRLDIMEADLRKILQKHPDDANALNALGYTLADRTDRYAEAQRYLHRAIELQPDEAVIIDSYGWLQFKRGNLQEALSYLRRAYDKLKEAEIAAHLVKVLWVMGRKQEARKVYSEALGVVPEQQELLDLQRRIPRLQ